MLTKTELSIVIGAIDKASSVLKAIGGNLSGLAKAASAPARAFQGLATDLGKIGLAGFGISAIANAARSAAGVLGIELNSAMEDTRAQLLAFTKDGAKADAILAEIRKEADKTPFAFDEMAKAVAGLMPAAKQAGKPLMDLVKQAEILAASNPMQGLEGAAFSLREAVSGDFTSIIERFNLPRSYLNQLKAEGVPALEAVSKAMLSMGYDADLVSNLATTAKGRWSTFMDTIDGIKRRIGSGLFDNLKTALTDAQGWLDSNKAKIDEWADRIGTVVANVTSLMMTTLPQAFAWFRNLPPEIQQVAIGLAALVTIGPPVAFAISMIGGALGFLIGPVGLVVAAAAALYIAWQHNFGGIRDVVAQILPPLIAWIETTVGGLIDWWNETLPLLEDAVKAVGGWIEGFWKGHGETIITLISSIWDAMNDIVELGGTVMGGLVRVTLKAISGDWHGAWNAMGDMLGNAWQSFQKIVFDGAAALAGAFNMLVRALGQEELAKKNDAAIAYFKQWRATQGWSNVAIKEFTYLTGASDDYNRKLRTGATDVRGYINAIKGLKNGFAGLFAPNQLAQWNKLMAEFYGREDKPAGMPDMGTGGGAAPPIANAGKAAKESKAQVNDYIDALIRVHPATLAAAAAVNTWETNIANVNLAISANKDQLQAAQAEYSRMSEHLTDLNNALSTAKERLSTLTSTKLTGMTAADETIAQIEQQLRVLKVQQLQGNGTGVDAQMAKLEKELELKRAIYDATYTEQQRRIKLAAEGPSKEMSSSEIISGIAQAQQQIAGLTGQISAQEAAMRSQQRAIADIQAAGEALNRTLAGYQDQLKQAQVNQSAVEEGLKTAYQWIFTDRAEVEKLGPAGVIAAAKVDERVRTLLGTIGKFAIDTSSTANTHMDAILTKYKDDVAAALAELNAMPKEWVTYVRTVVLPPEQVGSSSSEGNGAPPETRDSGGPGVAGRLYRIGTQEIYQPSVGGTFIPLGGASVAAGGAAIDYDRLAAAVANHQHSIEVDGRKLMTATRVAWRSSNNSRVESF